MEDFLAARLQMTVSFVFHIVFACIGMTMPWLMFVAEWKWIKTGKQVYLDLAKAWSRGVAIFFAVGAVSGNSFILRTGIVMAKIYGPGRSNNRYAFLMGRDSLFFGSYCLRFLFIWMETGKQMGAPDVGSSCWYCGSGIRDICNSS